jgi:chaperone required for assembly of F1-ATPase
MKIGGSGDASTLRKFYKDATVAQHADRKVWEIQLDGRTLKTSAQRDLHLPTRSLAQAIAYEWNAQDTKIVPNSMPVTQLVFTGIDNFGDDIDAIRDETAKYGETDLLCYRVSEPNALAALQDECWQPLLDWAAKQLDAPLTVTRGIMAVEQPAQSLFALRRPLDRLDILHITALRTLVGATGSLVLALAVYYGRLSPDETVELATLEERFQIETWGPDEDLESSLEGKREDARSAGTILAALSRLD